MRLLIIRHAPAVPRGTRGIPDDDRRLTPRGRARFRSAARGLARIARRPDVLLTSPLPRARETAEIAARAFGRLEPRPEPALAHGHTAGVLQALSRLPGDAMVAVVGHEPDLSVLLAALLGADRSEGLAFKKGGVALVDLPDGPKGPARLIWFLKPRILRALGDP